MPSADRGNREEWTGAGTMARSVIDLMDRQAIGLYPRKKGVSVPTSIHSYA